MTARFMLRTSDGILVFISRSRPSARCPSLDWPHPESAQDHDRDVPSTASENPLRWHISFPHIYQMEATRAEKDKRNEENRNIFGLEPMVLLNPDLFDSEDRNKIEKNMPNTRHRGIHDLTGIEERSNAAAGQEPNSPSTMRHTLNGQTKHHDAVTSSVNLDFLDIKHLSR